MSVRAGSLYRFVAVLMDRNIIPDGTIVRVVPASGMGVSGRLPSKFAYVEHADGRLIQMVCANSLSPLTTMERKFVRKVIRERHKRVAGFSIRSYRTPDTEEIDVQYAF